METLYPSPVHRQALAMACWWGLTTPKLLSMVERMRTVIGDGNTTTLLQKGSTLLKPFCKYIFFYFQLNYVWVDCLTLTSYQYQIKSNGFQLLEHSVI